MSTPARAAARRAAREEARAARYEVVMNTGWCEREADLSLLRLQTGRQLRASLGRSLRSRVRWHSYTGDEARKHMRLLIGSETDEALLASYGEVVANLDARGGFVVTAVAEAARL